MSKIPKVDYSIYKTIQEPVRPQEEGRSDKDPSKTSFNFDKPKETRKLADLYDKCSDELSNLLQKFVTTRDKELEQYINNQEVRISGEIEDYNNIFQTNLYAAVERLKIQMKTEVNRAISFRMEQALANAHITHPNGGALIISADDIVLTRALEASQIVLNLKAQLAKELEATKADIQEREGKLLQEKMAAYHKQVNTYQKWAKEHLEQMAKVKTTNTEEYKAEYSTEAIEHSIQQIVDNFQHMLMSGLDNQQADYSGPGTLP